MNLLDTGATSIAVKSMLVQMHEKKSERASQEMYQRL